MGKFFGEVADELILAARHAAWLSASPRTKLADGKEVVHPSRLDTAKMNGAEPPMPPLDNARYLYDWLFEIGPTEPGAMGRVEISWQTIDAWANRSSAGPEPWESRALRRASIAYIAESRAAEDVQRLPPWQAPRTQVDRDAEARHLRAVLRGEV